VAFILGEDKLPPHRDSEKVKGPPTPGGAKHWRVVCGVVMVQGAVYAITTTPLVAVVPVGM